MKRKFFRILLRFMPNSNGFWYRLREKVRCAQALCPKCRAWETAIANDKCPDCFCNDVLDAYAKEVLEEHDRTDAYP